MLHLNKWLIKHKQKAKEAIGGRGRAVFGDMYPWALCRMLVLKQQPVGTWVSPPEAPLWDEAPVAMGDPGSTGGHPDGRTALEKSPCPSQDREL